MKRDFSDPFPVRESVTTTPTVGPIGDTFRRTVVDSVGGYVCVNGSC